MAKRVPNPTLVHVSCALSKIPYVGFSPVRLQAEASIDQPYPSRLSHGIKRQVRIPPGDHRFDRTFVVPLPSCLHGEDYQLPPASGSFNDPLSPRVLCSERVMLSLSSSLLRPDPPVSTTPADFPGSLVIRRGFARRPDLGCPRDLPCFASVLPPYVPPSIRRQESWVRLSGSSPAPVAFPSLTVSQLLQLSRHRFQPGRVMTTLQGSLQAAARRVASLPGSIRPDAVASAAEDVYTRACSTSDHSLAESGMTTQHHRMDTVAGLTPAGALPLQAARKTSPHYLDG
jgi:hypothetical protein